jgi:hypothetical protein
MGYRRAGWYTYDLLDNGGYQSADRVLEESHTRRSATAGADDMLYMSPVPWVSKDIMPSWMAYTGEGFTRRCKGTCISRRSCWVA